MPDEAERYEALLRDFNLLGRIVKASKAPALAADLSRVDAIVNERIPEDLKKNAPPDYYEIYLDFKAEYELFHDFILFDRLIGKSVVALGGGFSSGKSRFLNTLDGESALPVDIDPSTSVPTFIVNGEAHRAFGINIFDARVEIELHEIPKIGHGFGAAADEDGRTRAENVTLGHVLERIFLVSPKQRHRNLAFLDTPGYSKPDTEGYSAKTDEQIARKQLNSANYMLWFVQADAGTILEEDVKFIKGLREDIPKLIIVNKADKKPEGELRDIVAKIEETLSLQGVRYEDVLCFSCVNSDAYDAERIREKIEAWNDGGYRPHFARNFEVLFSRCRAYYEEEIEAERRRLDRLNTSILKLESEDADVREQLDLLAKEITRNLRELIAVREDLTELKDAFFSEMKRIGDQVGIPMPMPSAIDMIDDAPDAMRVVLDHKKAKGIKPGRYAAGLLRDVFSDAKPAIGLLPGGGRYAEALADRIRQNCRPVAADVRVNDVCKRAEAFADAIRRNCRPAAEDVRVNDVCKRAEAFADAIRRNCRPAAEDVHVNDICGRAKYIAR
ncbi:MAG: dynamin family protein [Clostridiales Family XIII bacterium]|jgi:GTP-binding protein EngB required for normal cell division|nr:dynamin family protein [Clostridiales Family XIII bacterium]